MGIPICHPLGDRLQRVKSTLCSLSPFEGGEHSHSGLAWTSSDSTTTARSWSKGTSCRRFPRSQLAAVLCSKFQPAAELLGHPILPGSGKFSPRASKLSESGWGVRSMRLYLKLSRTSFSGGFFGPTSQNLPRTPKARCANQNSPHGRGRHDDRRWRHAAFANRR
jgi:hypothetical protein